VLFNPLLQLLVNWHKRAGGFKVFEMVDHLDQKRLNLRVLFRDPQRKVPGNVRQPFEQGKKTKTNARNKKSDMPIHQKHHSKIDDNINSNGDDFGKLRESRDRSFYFRCNRIVQISNRRVSIERIVHQGVFPTKLKSLLLSNHSCNSGNNDTFQKHKQTFNQENKKHNREQRKQ